MKTNDELLHYRYRGARAMVLLHDKEMRECVATLLLARSSGIIMPPAADSDYKSYESLLVHILGAARSYMTWFCEKLELPDPGIERPPSVENVIERCSDYLEHLLTQWRIPLANVPEEAFDIVFKSRWGIEYCLDGMLEHAVMHPIRHRFQIEEWMAEKNA
ncbi:MAG: hypothetical protein OEM52_05180 [bacterium]|nr:hypothetical protein [bacterium]